MLEKENLDQFSNNLLKSGKIFAPLKISQDVHSFKEVTSLGEADLDYSRTMIPPKKFFISPEEIIFTFDKETEEYYEVQAIDGPVVLFGVHACDLNALNLLAKVYLESFTDKYYSERRDNTTIIGISCTPDEYCFCKSTGTDYANNGFELFLHDIGEKYFVRVGSLKGYQLVEQNLSLFQDVTEEDFSLYKKAEKERLESFTKSLEMSGLQDLLDMSYDSPIWGEYGEKCLSCGSCNLVCPRCRCYDVQDYVDLNLETGERIRKWYSCMLKEHGLVAGGHNFRATSRERLRNRINCKGSLKEGMTNCVGCGRCTDFCPAEIDYVEILNKLRGEDL
ncbi:hydrogenase [Candidatus Bathyarchaeota archaeon]|nr:hydrogenase [Candidatus Bathyarchaeota archaeon]